MDQEQVGPLLTALLTAAFFGYLLWAGWRRSTRPTGIVRDEPDGTPYRIYTTKFDVEASAHDVLAVLRGNGFLRARGWVQTDEDLWQRNVAGARAIAVDPDGALADGLRGALARTDPATWAIVLLVDQSGSMKGDPIRHLAATLRFVAGVLTGAGLRLAIAGFSTVGWRGGEARAQWLADGRPPRPGRLAAMLYVRYQEFGAALLESDWAALLHPDLLRENIDGEALTRAYDLLRVRPEPNRLLVMLSDGAPVDDATLAYNGPAYLERHLRRTIADVQADASVRLAAVGIGYDVTRYYARSRFAAGPKEIAPALVDLLASAMTGPAGC